MPAIMILGFDLEITRVMLVAVLGGLLGILMMIPLRRALIVQQHGILKYPGGHGLRRGAQGRAPTASRARRSAKPRPRPQAARRGRSGRGRHLRRASASASSTSWPWRRFKLWKDTPEKVFGAPLAAGSIAAEISPELLGVGYIIGPRIAVDHGRGGRAGLSGADPGHPLLRRRRAGHRRARERCRSAPWGPDDIRGAYVLYIGAGAVAAGGIISLVRSLPMIWRGARAGGLARLGGRGGRQSRARRDAPRTDQDLSLRFVAIGMIGADGRHPVGADACR